MNSLFSLKRSSCVVILISLGLAACDGTIPSKPETDTSSVPEATTSSTRSAISPDNDIAANQEERHYRTPTDTLYALLVAEVAASRQQYATTIDHYTEQAKLTQEPDIIKRAARITQFLRSHQASLEMGLLWLEQDAYNGEALAIVANAYIEEGQPLQAIHYIERLLEQQAITRQLQPKAPVADGGALVETLANRSRRIDQDSRNTLITQLLSIAEKYPQSAGVHVGLGSLYQANGDNDSARKWIDKALTIDDTRTSTLLQDIRLLQLTQQQDLALTKLKTYVEQSPDNHRLRLVYARLLSQSNLIEAYEQFTILSEHSPNQLDIRFSRALIATELEKMDIARPLFESLLNVNYQPDNIHYYLGHIFDFQQQTDIALGHYLSVKQGEHLLSANYRAASVFLEKGEVSNAQDLYSALHRSQADKAEQLYEAEASLLVKYEANAEAMALLNTAITQFPDNSNLRYERATVHERLGELTLMEQDFRHVLGNDPNNVSALNGLGYLLAIHTSRYEEAHALIQKALQLNPDDAAIIDSMGWVLFKMGKIDEAIIYLKDAYSQFQDPEVAAHLGEALWVNGEKAAAKAVWKENLDKHPDADDIPKALKRLGVEW